MNARTTPVQKNISTATTASAGTHLAKADLGTLVDGVRSIVTIIMKMEIEIATDSAMIVAIGIPGAGTENLAKLGTPSVGVPDGQ